MAEISLNDFFGKNKKKKIKASNLNVVPASAKPEAKKSKSKDADEDGWEEEQVVVATMKVEVAGKLTRDEDKKEEEDSTAPAWGTLKSSKGDAAQQLNERKYPTLAKSVRVSSNINIDDGSETKVNIATSKNLFAALEDEEDDEEGEIKRPKEIKPVMVKKKQGERETEAIKREVDKYSTKKAVKKEEPAAAANKEPGEEAEDSDAAEEATEAGAGAAEEAAAAAAAAAEARKREKRGKETAEKALSRKEARPAVQEEDEGVKIVADLEAARAKYEGRRKPFPPKPLPAEELEAEKENKPKQQPSKKKKAWAEDEDGKPKLQYADWD